MNHLHTHCIKRLAQTALIASIGYLSPWSWGQAPATAPAAAASASETVRLSVNKSQVINTPRPYKRVNVAQPEIADVNTLGPNSLLLTAKKAGGTQIIWWDENEQSHVLEVVVQVDLQMLQEQLKNLFPDTTVEATSSGNSLILRGRAPDLRTAEQIAQVAAPYATKVLNFLEVSGGQQVMLHVQFAEVSRTVSTSLGANFGFSDGRSFGAMNVGQVNPFGVESGGGISNLTASNPNSSVSLFGQAQMGQTTLSYFISALRQNNLMRVLAEPNLVAISGQEASFLAGGDFPVPTVQSGSSGTNAITVEYREFGVKLNFVPIVLGDGRIRMKISPEVSDVDFSNAVRANGFLIPGRRTRKLSTTIELAEGQTFSVAGLLDNRMTAGSDVTPLLGDLPIIGALFRSVRYQRSETELVVLVTPRLVRALNPDQKPPMPGENWRYPTEAELFWDRDLGGPKTAPTLEPAKGAAPKFQGSYGFVPATAPAAK